MQFNEPELVFIQQGDKTNKNIYFSGTGSCIVTRTISVKKGDVNLGEIQAGQMMGLQSCIFDVCSAASLQSKSYCQMGVIL